ncbi:hypothetical protein Tco_1396556 [Tanacetum coccineum]
MVAGNGRNHFRQYARQNVRNQNRYNAVQNVGNQNRNGNLVASRAEGNGNGNNRNQLLIAQKEEAGIQLQAEEFDLMAAAGDLDEIDSAKTITTLNEEIANLNNQLLKENSTVSYLQQEKKKLKSDFKTREDELLDKQIQLENKIKELDNILIQQSLYNGKVLLEKHDPPAVYDSEETLQLAQESRLKMKQLNKEIKLANYAKINQLSEVFVSQKAKSREELYFSNTSKMASVSKSVSKSISIPNKEFSDDTSPTVAQKFLNELHKIVKDENFPILNQVDARVQHFKIQFLKEAAKFVQDFESLAKEADESLAKHMTLEYEIERLLRAVFSKDIMSIVQSNSVVDTSNLQTYLKIVSLKWKMNMLNFRMIGTKM